MSQHKSTRMLFLRSKAWRQVVTVPAYWANYVRDGMGTLDHFVAFGTTTTGMTQLSRKTILDLQANLRAAAKRHRLIYGATGSGMTQHYRRKR